MAVSILDAFATVTTTDPNGTQTISAGSQRLAVLCWACEFSAEVSFSTMEIGGVTPTGSELTFWENGSADQHAYAWWWNEAAISSFADNDIDSEDSAILSKQSWSFVVFDGVDQSTPVISQGTTDTSTDSLGIASTSTANDHDIVIVSRESANRDITSGDTLTQRFQTNTTGEFTAYCASGTGGDSTITIQGDGIADDMTYTHLIIKAASGVSDVNLQGVQRGVQRGLQRGIDG